MHRCSSYNRKSAFTLIELLVVISIVGLFSSVVLAAVQSVRGKGSVAAGQNFDRHTYGALYDDLIVSWDFDGDSSSPIKDQSGYGNDLTYTGNTIGPSTVQNPFKSGKSFFINPSGSTVDGGGTGSAQSASNLKGIPAGNSNFSVSFWVYPQYNVGVYEHISNGLNLGSMSIGTWSFSHNAIGGLFYFNLRMLAGSSQFVTASSLKVNTWQHVAGVCEGTKAFIFLDGKLAGTLSGTLNAPCALSQANPIEIKGYSMTNDNKYPYYVDNVRVYKKALTLATVRDLYIAELPKFQSLVRNNIHE